MEKQVDYYNAIVDRKSGAQITIALTDIYLESYENEDFKMQLVRNKYTDQAWVVDTETYSKIESQMHGDKKKG